MDYLKAFLLLSITVSSYAIHYNGKPESWARYSKWNACPLYKKAEIELQFSTAAQNGLLFYMDDGGDKDYLLVKVKDMYLEIEYSFGTLGSPTVFTRNEEPLKLNHSYTVHIERQRMRFYVKLDREDGTGKQLANSGDDLCIGRCLENYALSERNSFLMVGGLPPNARFLPTDRPDNFKGEIKNLVIKNCQCHRTSPEVEVLGNDIKAIAAEDGCTRRRQPNSDCSIICVDGAEKCSSDKESCSIGDSDYKYELGDFSHQFESHLINSYGLDALVFGDPKIDSDSGYPYLQLTDKCKSPDDCSYAIMAGPSQRDECLGNLALCKDGYTISFWMAINNPDLVMRIDDTRRAGILVDNGGYDTHGIAVYWQDGKLHTKFKKPNGETWRVAVDNFWPARVHRDGKFIDYWYHYSATWSQDRGLSVYINGIKEPHSQYDREASVVESRHSFEFLGPNGDNNMKIADVKFKPRRMVTAKGLLTHYFLSMNDVTGNQLQMYPSTASAYVNGPVQLEKGRADHAIMLGNLDEGTSYVEIQETQETCFGSVDECTQGMLVSFWVKFDEIVPDMTLVDTGPSGITIKTDAGRGRLIAQRHDGDGFAQEVSWDNPIRAGQWYFVELNVPKSGASTSANTSPGDLMSLYIDQELVDNDSTFKSVGYRGNPENKNVFIGRNSVDNVKGKFTIDNFEMISANRELLLDLGHIQRGIPPHAFFNMDGMLTMDGIEYIDYTNQSLEHDARAQWSGGNNQFRPGKNLNATYFSDRRDTFRIPHQIDECYSNLGWFNVDELVNNGRILSTGVNGINLEYRNGQLWATADTRFRHWETSSDFDVRQWQFLEISYHPKYGLSLYVDEERQNRPDLVSSMNSGLSTTQHDFVIGGTYGSSSEFMPMLVDDFEIWYLDRDQIYAQCLLAPCPGMHYIIDFDEEDRRINNQRYLQHQKLKIPFNAQLIPGKINQAMQVRGGTKATVTEIKASGTQVKDHCLGNLNLCPSGYTIKFWLKPQELSSQRTYFLSTGKNGINVYYENGRLKADAEARDKIWSVESEPGYLELNEWEYVIVSWSPVYGLVMAKLDSKDYLVDRDSTPQQNTNRATTSEFLIGDTNRPNRGITPKVTYDEMIFRDRFLDPEKDYLTKIYHESFSFERNHLSPSIVEHPKYRVQLIDGARIIEGEDTDVGNMTSLDGRRQYVSIGSHPNICFGNLDKCKTGLTLSFRLKPRNRGYVEDQVILSGDSYDISIVNGGLTAKFMNSENEWVVQSFALDMDESQLIELSWSEDDGLSLYQNGVLRSGPVGATSRNMPVTRDNDIYIGRAIRQGDRQFYNGDIDEVHFWHATRQILAERGLAGVSECDFARVIIPMDNILSNGQVENEVPDRIVMTGGRPDVYTGLIDNAIELKGRQYINAGPRVSCQSRPNECGNGFFMRVSIRPSQLVRGSYLISSKPVELRYGSDNLLYVEYKVENTKWSSTLSGLTPGKWYTIDLSWDNENGMTVYVNNVQRSWLQKSNTASSSAYGEDSSFMIGLSETSSTQSYSSFLVDDLQVWDAKFELLQACGLVPPAPEVRHNAIYPPSGEGYIRLFYLPEEYNFDYGDGEELMIRFQTGDGNGLLWYNQDRDVTSYVYLQDGVLYFVTDDGSGNIQPQRIGRITINEDITHQIKMRSEDGNKIVFTVNEGSPDMFISQFDTDHTVRLIREDFSIGGHRQGNAAVTNNLVRTGFTGIIKDVILTGSRDNQKFDIFDQLWKNVPNYVRIHCNVTFDPVIYPVCDYGESPITFETEESNIKIGEWVMIGQKPSLEVRFTTVDPKGLLLFTGSASSDFFALEIFDRKLYMVTDLGNGPITRQVSSGDVADNTPHTARFVFNTDENKINVEFDDKRRPDQDISLMGRNPSDILFTSEIYLGGLPDGVDYPWKLYSRRGFQGCVEEVQINTLTSKLQELVRQQGAAGIKMGCQPLPDHCLSDPCENDGVCQNSFSGYTCDCKGLQFTSNSRTDYCQHLALVAPFGGDDFYDIMLGGDKRTHTNDISVMFKTPSPTGTIFMTDSPQTTDYLKAYMEDGKLKVAISINGVRTVRTLPGLYDDDEWHRLYIQRRADDLSVWADDQTMQPESLNLQDFYLRMNKIRIGADAPVPRKPYFYGNMKNLDTKIIWPNGKPPFTGLEQIIVVDPVTFQTTDAHLYLTNGDGEMLTNFKLKLNIKTEQKDSLFMYQPGIGQSNQHLAALLKDGKLDIRFNFGSGNELISSPEYLADDEWHSIVLWRKSADQMELKVDNNEPIVRTISGQSGTQFIHGNNMYLGGVPGSEQIVPWVRDAMTEGYKGCISTVVKSKRVQGLWSVTSRWFGAVKQGCVPLPKCNVADCMNGCTCSADGSVCDTINFPFVGIYCENYTTSAKFWDGRKPGYIKYDFPTNTDRSSNMISFGFITCHPNGLLAKISGATDREHITISLVDGKVKAEYQLGANSRVMTSDTRYDDSKFHTVQFRRDGLRAHLNITSLDGSTEYKQSLLRGNAMLDGIFLLEIGSVLSRNREYINPFKGIISGFKHDSVELLNLVRRSDGRVRMKTPGTALLSPSANEPFDLMDLHKCEKDPPGTCGLPGKRVCENFGVCENFYCNCSLTAYKGEYCTEPESGVYYGYTDFGIGAIHHSYPETISTNNDYLSLGFVTDEPTGDIFKVQSVDGSQYYRISLVDGYAQLEYNLDGIPNIIKATDKMLNSTPAESTYHVIRMNRTEENVVFNVDGLSNHHKKPELANIPFRQKDVTIGGRYDTNTREWDGDFTNSIIAGLNYNGKRILDLQTGRDTTWYGDLERISLPYKLHTRPVPVCSVCERYGVAAENGLCDCTYTAGFTGICCSEREDDLWGFHHKAEGNNSVIIYDYSMPGTSIDNLSVGFRTGKGWGNSEIVRIASRDGVQYIIVETINDRIQVRHNIGGGAEKITKFSADIGDKSEHRLILFRNGTYGRIRLDDQVTDSEVMFRNGNIFNSTIIYAGGHYVGATDVTKGFYGTIWGLVYNGMDIVDLARNGDLGNFKLVALGEDGKNFQIVKYPWPEIYDKGTVPPVVPPTLGSPGGAGAIVPNIGGAGPVPVPVGTGSGGAGGGVSTGALVGAIMGGLLFSSAIAWAAFGMKPGFMALSRGMAGAAGKGAYVPVGGVDKAGAFPTSNGKGNFMTTIGMEDLNTGSQYGGVGGGGGSQYEESFHQESRFDGTDGGMNGSAVGGAGGYNQNQYNTSSSWYQRNETLENQGYGTGYGMNGGGMRSGYAGSVAGGSVAGSTYGFGTVTNPDQAFITLSEDIAVDNVVLTADGRYVVTGSNMGPPQVWNTSNGEMVTTMKGDYMGSTGLHLAANEQYLVGETMAEQAAVDMNDIQTGNHIPIRRVAVWDFNSGNPLPIAVDQLCTASCVSKDGYRVVMAMTDKFGGGTTVKVLDLLSNAVEAELTYPDTIGVADSASCVFISPDDRFVAVGFTNSFDNNANFIVFDLQNKGSVVDSPIVALNADPHCTVILNHDEALTGTRNGELVIWSMKTGKAQRQLTSGDATMLGFGGMPAAHDREVKEVSLSDDGKYLASASADRTVKIWNMDTESLLHTLSGHNDEVWTVDIASDNSIIVSGSQDGTIKLWRLKNGNQVTSFNATMDIFHARFSKDKRTVVALGDKYGSRKLIMLQIVSQKKWRVKP